MDAVHWDVLWLTRAVFHVFPLNSNFWDFFFNRDSSILDLLALLWGQAQCFGNFFASKLWFRKLEIQEQRRRQG